MIWKLNKLWEQWDRDHSRRRECEKERNWASERVSEWASINLGNEQIAAAHLHTHALSNAHKFESCWDLRDWWMVCVRKVTDACFMFRPVKTNGFWSRGKLTLLWLDLNWILVNLHELINVPILFKICFRSLVFTLFLNSSSKYKKTFAKPRMKQSRMP